MKSDDNRNSLGAQLLEAIRLQDVERVRALLTAGADPNTREPDRIYVYHYGYMPTRQETALTLACNAITEARIVIVRLLLDCGADPEARIGGPALANANSPLLPALLDHCDAHAIPLHFVSWHIYNSDPLKVRATIDYVHELLGDHENVIASRIPDREHILNSIKEFLGKGA